jgi:putative membrane protein
MRTLKFISTVFLSLLLLSCSQTKQNDDSKDVAEEQNDERFDDTAIEDDTQFAVEAADGAMMEIQLGNLALKNAMSSEVKNFAQTMISDHGKANDELVTLAASKGISLPTELSDENQKKVNELSSKTGAEFDKAYCDFMIKDHKDDIDKFKKQAEKGNDADIKAWAAEKIPALEQHLALAESMNKTVEELN